MFPQEISYDLMILDKLTVLYLVDIQKIVGLAVFILGQTFEETWRAIIQCWVCIYIGYSANIKVDQVKQFISRNWSEMSIITAVEIITSGVESFNSI